MKKILESLIITTTFVCVFIFTASANAQEASVSYDPYTETLAVITSQVPADVRVGKEMRWKIVFEDNSIKAMHKSQKSGENYLAIFSLATTSEFPNGKYHLSNEFKRGGSEEERGYPYYVEIPFELNREEEKIFKCLQCDTDGKFLGVWEKEGRHLSNDVPVKISADGKSAIFTHAANKTYTVAIVEAGTQTIIVSKDTTIGTTNTSLELKGLNTKLYRLGIIEMESRDYHEGFYLLKQKKGGTFELTVNDPF